MITQERLKQLLEYNKKTGLFHWHCTGQGRKKDRVAGTVNDNGYLMIMIDKKGYRAHILALLYITGEAPPLDVDHINHDRLDNSFGNLRKVSRKENLKNRSVGSNNKSGVIGVSWAKEREKWNARIGTDKGYKNLGYFTNKKDAVEARKIAEVKNSYHENHGKNARIQP
jgi:hypothetical protein